MSKHQNVIIVLIILLKYEIQKSGEITKTSSVILRNIYEKYELQKPSFGMELPRY